MSEIRDLTIFLTIIITVLTVSYFMPSSGHGRTSIAHSIMIEQH